MVNKKLKALKAENKALEIRNQQLFDKFVENGKAKTEAELKLRIATRALQGVWDTGVITYGTVASLIVEDALLLIGQKLATEQA